MEDSERERVQREASEVLASVPDWVWDGDTPPVPVEDIADSCFDLLVRDVELEQMAQAPGCPPLEEGVSLSGLFLAAERTIWVNAGEAREWPTRRRFTIAHELGHCVLHQDGQRALFCRHGSVEPPNPDREDAGPQAAPEPLALIEQEANQFAAELLMPAPLIRHHYRETGGDFHRLCEIFSCSGAAMGRRLHQVI